MKTTYATWEAIAIQNIWEKYYSAMKRIPKNLREPVPYVVVDTVAFKKRFDVKTILDLGCGLGRHSVFLAKNGFDVVGVDISKSALMIAKKWICKERLENVALLRANMTALPFKDSYFHMVISVSVIHHALKSDIEKAIAEIHRVLKKNGLLLTNLASKKDRRYGKGVMVEKDTFLLTEKFGKARFKELHHFFTKSEVSKLLVRFTKVKIENLEQYHCFWKITAFK